MTRLRDGRPENLSSIPEGPIHFFSSLSSHTGTRAHLTCSLTVTGGSFPEGKAVGMSSWYSSSLLLSENFSLFYWARRFINVFARACDSPVLGADSIHSKDSNLLSRTHFHVCIVLSFMLWTTEWSLPFWVFCWCVLCICPLSDACFLLRVSN
jgi:hypothetical protein